MTRKNLSRRNFLRMGAVSTAGLALIGCGAPPTAPVEPQNTEVEKAVVEEQPVPEPTPTFRMDVMGSGGVEINMWDGIGASDGDILSAMIKEITDQDPGLSVKRQIMPWGTYFDKLAAAVVAGSGGPDLFVLWHSVVPQYAKTGYLYPIADVMFEEGLLPKDDILPQVLNSVNIDGKTWTVPFDNYGVGVYVNLDLLEQAGIDYEKPPKNQQEFLEYARLLTTDKNGKHPNESGFDPESPDVYGFVVDWPRATIQPTLYQWGGDVISRDDSPKALINSEGSTAAVQFWVDAIFNEHIAPNPAGFNTAEAWVNNKIAMWPSGSWMFNFHNQQDVRTALWPFPQVGPERGSTIMWSHTFAVSKNISPEKLEGVKKLIKNLSDNSATWTEKAGMPCARLSKRVGLEDKVWTLPVFDKQFPEEGVMEFGSPKFSEILGAAEPAWSSALSREKPVKEALDTAAELINRALSM
jgi:ABC-type glycerol-3-phosphate transport system substrate-binding protein